MAGGKKFNISEVAQAAGVSKMTVSRMLNNTGIVAAATREKVQRVIDRYHYQPNPIARGLASRRTFVLGLMIFEHMDMDYHFFQLIFFGVEQEARLLGYDMLLFSNPRKAGGRENRCLGLVDGVICFGTNIDNKAVEYLEDRGIPHVVIGRRLWLKANPRSCVVDYFNGFREAVNYLLKLGHRRIAFWGGCRDFSVDLEKHQGYRQALCEAGIPGEEGMDLYDEEAARIRNCIERYRPTALIMEGTRVPLPLLINAREMGLRIPEDLSVIYTRRDFIDIHSLYDLAGIHELTMISVPRRELGAAGFRLLNRIIEGEENVPGEVTIGMEFILGESCAPPGKAPESGRKNGCGKEDTCEKIKNQI
ncbi:MAG: LacI family transcriptional regulator [Treponema sp.]|jgi:LacI family transcriptional regulator/LacI family repressor for deo operon, udp, cdd, tsx, nupC, and nupG|nr:LacI family transcriptional regulator [Treponema sp.]